MKGITLGRQLAWSICVHQGMTFEESRHAVNDFFSGSRAILHADQHAWISQMPTIAECIHNHSLLSDFESRHLDWIVDHRYNQIAGLQDYEADISQGCSQAFDSFLLRHSTRRVVCLLGEYFYHAVSCAGANRQFCYIKNVEDILPHDCVIISVPFCDTGSKHPDTDAVLERCEKLGVPVLLDCAYWTLSRDIDLKIDYSCIDTVVFSFSKTWPVAHARAGVRYTRSHVKDGQKLHRNIGYNNRLSAAVGLHVMKHYRADYLIDKHWNDYVQLVHALGLTLSHSVIFADGDQSWEKYSRRSLLDLYGLDLPESLFRRRICLTRVLESWHLVENILNDYQS